VKIAVFVTTPPGPRASAALRMARSLASAGHEISTIFAGDGVLAAIKTAPKPDVPAGFVELESLGAGMAHELLQPVMRGRILSLLDAQDAVIGG
jgi:sulfur relay (sulfurtransferase) complex TusBCD TusD component (DsrE family)